MFKKEVDPYFYIPDDLPGEEPATSATPVETTVEETPDWIQAEAAAYVGKNGDDPGEVFDTGEVEDTEQTGYPELDTTVPTPMTEAAPTEEESPVLSQGSGSGKPPFRDNRPTSGEGEEENSDETNLPKEASEKAGNERNETNIEAASQRYGVSAEDFAFAQAALGKDIRLDPNIPTDKYDERREICQRAIKAREEMRGSMAEWAKSQNIPVSEEVINNWQPNETELEALRAQLTDERIKLRMIQGIKDFSADQEEAADSQGLPLLDYQLDASQGTYDFLAHQPANEHGGKSGNIDMPTGSGKGGLIIDAAAKLKHADTDEEPAKVLILAPTIDICEQIATSEMQKFAPHLAPKTGMVNQFDKQLDAEIVVMTNASFWNLARENKLPHTHAVIADESHTLIGDVTSKYVQEYTKDKLLIGFTATPEYSEDRSVYKKLFDTEIYQMNFQDAVRTGRLAPVRGYVHTVEPRIDEDKLPKDPEELKQVLRGAHLLARMQHAEGIIMESVRNGKSVIVSCPPGNDIDYAVGYRGYLNGRIVGRDENSPGGVRRLTVEVVGGSLNRETWEERQEKYAAFNRGEVDVLVNVQAISMGVNLPPAKTQINIDDTGSMVRERQRIGRVMRKFYKDGKLVEAEVHDYLNPHRKTPQYTCLDAFGSEQGELLSPTNNRDGEAPIPLPRRFRPLEQDSPRPQERKFNPELIDRPTIANTTTDEIAVLHEHPTQQPPAMDVLTFVENQYGNKATVGQTSELLGVSRITAKQILAHIGMTPGADVTREDFEAIYRAYPHLRSQPLPETGYLSARETALQAPELILTHQLLSFAKSQSAPPQRFFNAQTRKTEFYFTEEEAATLHRQIGEGKFRVSRFGKNRRR